MTAAADGSARVTVAQTLFAAELRLAVDNLELVSVTWDDLGRLKVTLPERVYRRVDADWIRHHGDVATAARALAGLLWNDWRRHLERAGRLADGVAVTR
jgi:hypothetical protein